MGSIGSNTNLIKQVEIQQGLPFEVKLPNTLTKRALQEAKDSEELPRFDSPSSLFDDLDI